MEYSPPPLFKQGAPARVKVTVFALISIALLVMDSRLNALTIVRQITGTILYPLQVAALAPRNVMAGVGSYFSSLSSMQRDVRELKNQQLLAAQSIQQAQFQIAENAQLRRLLGAREHVPVQSLMSEILYDARDPSTRKIVLDRGLRDNVKLGLPVIDGAGVVGQITRVFPMTSEVTLLTDKEQAIPVQVLRNGLRSVAYGRGQTGLLELRFVVPNADILVGDVLITSGMDGVYPAGLAVAKVVRVENSAGGQFGGVVCQPLAGIDRHRQVLILMSLPSLPAAPGPEAAKPVVARSKLPKMVPVKELPPLLPAPAATSATAPAPGAPAATPLIVPTASARRAPAPQPPAAPTPETR